MQTIISSFRTVGIQGKIVFDDKNKYATQDEWMGLNMMLKDEVSRVFNPYNPDFPTFESLRNHPYANNPYLKSVSYMNALRQAITTVQPRVFTISIRELYWFRRKNASHATFDAKSNTLEIFLCRLRFASGNSGMLYQFDLQNALFVGLGLASLDEYEEMWATERLLKRRAAVTRYLSQHGLNVNIQIMEDRVRWAGYHLDEMLVTILDALIAKEGLGMLSCGRTMKPGPVLARTLDSIRKKGLTVELLPARKLRLRYLPASRTLRYEYRRGGDYGVYSSDEIRGALMDALGGE